MSPLAGTASADVSVEALITLIAERLVLAADVAAAKFVEGGQIDDPVREKEVLEWAGGIRGRDGERQASAAFFADQIVANKVVQRGLHRYWQQNPEVVPEDRRDLTGEIRPRLDVIGKEMMALLPSVPPLTRDGLAAADALLQRELGRSLPLRPVAGIRRAVARIALQSLVMDR